MLCNLFIVDFHFCLMVVNLFRDSCSCVISDQSVRGLFEHFLAILEAQAHKERQDEIHETQQIHGALLHTILRRINGSGSVPATAGRPPSGAALPLTSMEEFRRREEKLGTDDEFTKPC